MERGEGNNKVIPKIYHSFINFLSTDIDNYSEAENEIIFHLYRGQKQALQAVGWFLVLLLLLEKFYRGEAVKTKGICPQTSNTVTETVELNFTPQTPFFLPLLFPAVRSLECTIPWRRPWDLLPGFALQLHSPHVIISTTMA